MKVLQNIFMGKLMKMFDPLLELKFLFCHSLLALINFWG